MRENRRILGIAGLALVVVALLGVWVIGQDDQDKRQVAETNEAQSDEKADAALDTLEALCDAGYKSACDAAKGIGEIDSPDPDDEEIQELERQEPEIQEQERQEREQQEREVQEAERQNPESQDGEEQDDEVQDSEDQEAEIQEDEIQDDEIDDPDPNSQLKFAIRDECANPLADPTYAWELTGDTLTLVVTC